MIFTLFFASKKRKIREYLTRKPEGDKTAFDLLLGDYLDGRLKADLEALGITKSEIYVDWSDDMKCIGIQGQCRNHYADIQIDPDTFSVSFDRDEPDDDTVYPLTGKEEMYRIISDRIAALK